MHRIRLIGGLHTFFQERLNTYPVRAEPVEAFQAVDGPSRHFDKLRVNGFAELPCRFQMRSYGSKYRH